MAVGLNDRWSSRNEKNNEAICITKLDIWNGTFLKSFCCAYREQEPHCFESSWDCSRIWLTKVWDVCLSRSHHMHFVPGIRKKCFCSWVVADAIDHQGLGGSGECLHRGWNLNFSLKINKTYWIKTVSFFPLDVQQEWNLKKDSSMWHFSRKRVSSGLRLQKRSRKKIRASSDA